MTRKQWEALAARCEAATGPDREIDALIWNAVHAPGSDLPAGAELTASLDAITALIERELPGSLYLARQLWDKKEKTAFASIFEYFGEYPSRYAKTEYNGLASTPALALCAAFCRAMAERTAS